MGHLDQPREEAESGGFHRILRAVSCGMRRLQPPLRVFAPQRARVSF